MIKNTLGNVLVTGGAGYIGCHFVHLLSRCGQRPIVVDSLVRGTRSLVPPGTIFYEKDIGDIPALTEIIKRHEIDSVIHFAAFVSIDESILHPEVYYENNLTKAERLLRTCLQSGVSNFIFSSTAAVYGEANESLVKERLPSKPTNPYAASKQMFERILRDVSRVRSLRYVILRYFNAAGASPDGVIGQIDKTAIHLVKVACEAACGLREKVEVYGNDYPTRDGTGLRDYIHVSDLAVAHLKALEYLSGGGTSATLNVGTGQGFTVLEVLSAMKKISGVDFQVEMKGRRSGDVAALVADTRQIQALFNWSPSHSSLEEICKTAYDWEKKLQRGRVGSRVSQAEHESPTLR